MWKGTKATLGSTQITTMPSAEMLILPAFLISWAKSGPSKFYPRPSFKPCDEIARRFLGDVVWLTNE